jgi:hypothetical protein
MASGKLMQSSHMVNVAVSVRVISGLYIVNGPRVPAVLRFHSCAAQCTCTVFSPRAFGLTIGTAV